MDTMPLWPVFVATVIVFGIALAAMAIGVMVSGRCLTGSCGGPDAIGPAGERLSCATCPNRRKAEEEPPANARA